MEGSEDKHSSEVEVAGISVLTVFTLHASKGSVKVNLRLSDLKRV